MNTTGYVPVIKVDGQTCEAMKTINTLSCSGHWISVRLSAPFKFAMPFMGGAILNLSSESTGTILQPACGT